MRGSLIEGGKAGWKDILVTEAPTFPASIPHPHHRLGPVTVKYMESLEILHLKDLSSNRNKVLMNLPFKSK